MAQRGQIMGRMSEDDLGKISDLWKNNSYSFNKQSICLPFKQVFEVNIDLTLKQIIKKLHLKIEHLKVTVLLHIKVSANNFYC